jgi:hypothetical protein|eukprot:SAG25_NODE_610_length_6556_cov_22.114500_5_plen_142_part_00
MISPRTRASPRRRYLELLLRTAAHPSAAVSISPLRALRALLRNEALRRLPIMQQLTGAVVRLVLAKLPRVHDPICCRADASDSDSGEAAGGGASDTGGGDDGMHVSAKLADLDFDDADAFRMFYGERSSSRDQPTHTLSLD